MAGRKYFGRGLTPGPKRGILSLESLNRNCCNQPGPNNSCKEVRKENPKSLIQTPVEPSNPLAKEEKGE